MAMLPTNQRNWLGSKRPSLWVLVAFLVIGFAAFSTILNSYFLSDEFGQIGKVLRGDLSVSWGQSHGGFFRPLFILSYLIDSKIWGVRPFGFHLTNVALHSMNAFLVFLLTLKLMPNHRAGIISGRLISLGAGLLFLLNPSHTEAVSWISGRADLISAFFGLASLSLYLTFLSHDRTLYLLLSFTSFTPALLAKESAICVPLLVFVIGVAAGHWQKNRKQLLGITGVFILILLAFVLVRSFFLGTVVGGYGAGQHLNFAPSWLLDRFLQGTLRSLLPTLPQQWSFFLLKPLMSRTFFAIMLVCAVLVVVAIVYRRKSYGLSERNVQNRFVLLIATLFLVSFLPVMNLRLSLFETSGERFVYLPSVFSCILVSYLMAICVRHTGLWLLLLICLLSSYSVWLYQTNQIWRAAAVLSQSIKDDLVNSSSRQRLLILNAPDNFRGVPLYRNGLPDAIQYFQDQKHIEQVEITSFHDLHSGSDEVALIRLPVSIKLILLNQMDSLTETRNSECAEVLGRTNQSLELRLLPCSLNMDIYFFSQGRMNKISDR
jgi:protein O-mannosyl-transferase